MTNILCIGAGYVGGPTMAVSAAHFPQHRVVVLPSFESWLTLIIRELMNLLVGEVVLRVPKDAPSRRYFGDKWGKER